MPVLTCINLVIPQLSCSRKSILLYAALHFDTLM